MARYGKAGIGMTAFGIGLGSNEAFQLGLDGAGSLGELRLLVGEDGAGGLAFERLRSRRRRPPFARFCIAQENVGAPPVDRRVRQRVTASPFHIE